MLRLQNSLAVNRGVVNAPGFVPVDPLALMLAL